MLRQIMLLSSWESHHIPTPQLPGASVAWTEQVVGKTDSQMYLS